MATKAKTAPKEQTAAEPVEEKALAPVPEQAIANIPQMSEAELTQAYGDMDKEHVSIPRLVILEQLNPEVGNGQGKMGDFFVKGINQNLGAEPLEVVVLMRSHSRIKWKEISQGGGIVCQALDGKTGVGDPGGSCERCTLKSWNGSVKPQCDLYENFIVVLRNALTQGEAFPMAISGSRARLKGLKDFNTVLMQSIQKRRPLFYKSYLIKSLEKVNPKIPGNNKYHIFQVSVGNNNAPLPDAEQLEAYELFKTFAGRSFTIDQEVPTTEAPAAAPGSQSF